MGGIQNPVSFIGQTVLGATIGVPLSVDANGGLQSLLPGIYVTATASTTTNSGTDALLNSMTSTPAAGTYSVQFNCDVQCNSPGGAVSFSIYVGGSQIAVSLLKTIPLDGGTLSIGTGRDIIFLIEEVAVNGSQAVEVRWSTSSGTATVGNRKLRLRRES